jgi:hypothetical protein
MLGMICFDLVCGITTDEMKDGESTSWVCGKPLVRDANEMAVEDEEMFAIENASCDGLSRGGGHGVGEGRLRAMPGCATQFANLSSSSSSFPFISLFLFLSRGHVEPFLRRTSSSSPKAVILSSSTTTAIPPTF